MTTFEPPKTIPQPVLDVCALLGVPEKDGALFQRWADQPLKSKALDELHAYVDVMIAERCRKPGADLLSTLIETGVDGDDLTCDELRAVVVALVSRRAGPTRQPGNAK